MTEQIAGFQLLQRKMLAYLRDPDSVSLPNGLSKQRMTIYADLLYNKFNDSLAACFPVTHAILGDVDWKRLVKSFIAQHRCKSPYYRQIPDEFMKYLETERADVNDPPYLVELAHFEWIEMILAITEAEPDIIGQIAPTTEWLDQKPVFVPVMRLLSYAYPVHRINTRYLPSAPPEQATHILGYRKVDNSVEFIELTPATARLLTILHTTGHTGRQALGFLAEELRVASPASLYSFAADTLAELMEQGVLLGTIPVN